MAAVSDSTRTEGKETREVSAGRDRSFLTISTGNLVEAEITPAILDVLRACKTALDHDVSLKPGACVISRKACG